MSNWRREFLEYYFSDLNEPQKEAVFTLNGPVLVLSGAGSGKTTVIVNRILNMILFGNACNAAQEQQNEYQREVISKYINGEKIENFELAEAVGIEPIKPWNILSITFTNKAAGEMKERLKNLLGDIAEDINASTFHSCCAQILRREASHLGFTSSFTIYDSDDTKRLVTSCMNELNIDQKTFPVKSIIYNISMSKNNLITPEMFEADTSGESDDYRKKVISACYRYYNQRLKEANAFDFDDLLMKTVELFQKFPDVLEKYQNRFKYILVDEYQDTNYAQYVLISLLAKKYKNLCVVGDDDQSIYKFRGATIENILNFEEHFPNCKTIKLEQNYRSTSVILDAANSIIKNNVRRKTKKLFTDKKGGSKIIWYNALNEDCEAEFIKKEIEKGVKDGGKYSDYAVLYRMNALSKTVEQAFFNKIPYKIYGGLRFYDRKEIRDIIAYLSIIVNDFDMVRLNRVINVPKRGIGDATLETLTKISRDLAVAPLEIMEDAKSYPALSRKATELENFAKLIIELKYDLETSSLSDFIDVILDKTGYKDMLKALGDEGEERLQNIFELKTSLSKYEDETEDASLEDFLEGISLYTDVDKFEQQSDTVSLMTIHSSKGLEFKNVFIIAMENGVFPSYHGMYEPEEMEEERRLAYVAVTRAKSRLYFTTTKERRLFGKYNKNAPSEFLLETDNSLIEKVEEKKPEIKSFKSISGGSGAVFSKSKVSPLNNLENVDLELLKTGKKVLHPKFGYGTIVRDRSLGSDKLLEIAFDDVGTKTVMAKYAKLKIV